MKIKKRVPDKTERLNLVPIMDAVFIFIFFLLFSAQFIKIFEIEMNAPVVSERPSENKEDESLLQLTLKLDLKKIEIFTGINKKLVKTIYKDENNYLEVLNEYMIILKNEYPEDKDDYVIINPAKYINYEEIVKTIESIQLLKIKDKTDVNKKLFKQVVLEPLIEN